MTRHSRDLPPARRAQIARQAGLARLADRIEATMTTIHEGDRVRVTGARGTVIAHVQRCCPPAELPALPGLQPEQLPAGIRDGAEFAHVAARYLDELGVDRVAMISYTNDAGEALLFAAVHLRGRWQDLQGQTLEIEPAPAT